MTQSYELDAILGWILIASPQAWISFRISGITIDWFYFHFDQLMDFSSPRITFFRGRVLNMTQRSILPTHEQSDKSKNKYSTENSKNRTSKTFILIIITWLVRGFDCFWMNNWSLAEIRGRVWIHFVQFKWARSGDHFRHEGCISVPDIGQMHNFIESDNE